MTKIMVKNINAQMVHKPSLKGGSGSKVEAEAANVSEQVAQAFVGKDMWKCTAKSKVVRCKLKLPMFSCTHAQNQYCSTLHVMPRFVSPALLTEHCPGAMNPGHG